MGLRQSLRRIAAKNGNIVVKEIKNTLRRCRIYLSLRRRNVFYVTSETDDMEVSSIVIKSWFIGDLYETTDLLLQQLPAISADS